MGSVKHKHHIVPRHAGGSDDPSNLVEVSVEEHAQLHFALYLEHGKVADWIAYHCLSGKTSAVEECRIELCREMATGRLHSAESRHKMSLARIGKKTPHKETTKAKIGEANGRQVYCPELNKTWYSAAEAARDLKSNKHSISRCCNGKQRGVRHPLGKLTFSWS